MLKKLSIRNAKRQAKEYLLFFITMIVAVAMLYTFNSFVFSATFTQLNALLSETGGTGISHTIFFYSLLIVLVIGWLVSYMLHFMLQKRSKELGTYMLLGIEKKKIATMFVGENCFIGLLALAFGFLFGFLISEIFEAIIVNLYSGSYTLSPGFSLKAIGLTIIHFVLIYIISLAFSRYRLKNIKLIRLLYFEKYNENPHITSSAVGIVLFCFSLFCGIASIVVFLIQPLGDFRDFLLGFGFIIFCSFGIFIGISPVLNKRLENNKKWKYKHANMFIYRAFTAKAKKMSLSFGFIATLFTIAMVMISAGVSYGLSVNKVTELEAFDLMILHMGEECDFSGYRDYALKTAGVDANHSYSLYTLHENNLISERNKILKDYFLDRKIEATPEEYLYSENQYDTYMKYSDYCTLREMLGLEPVAMGMDEFIVHSMPYLQNGLNKYINEANGLDVAGKALTCAGIYTESFSQYDGYGNGQELLVVIPDHLTSDMDVLYSLFAANLKASVDLEYLIDFQKHFPALGMLDVNFVEGTTTENKNHMTRLFANADDYLSGKYVIFATRTEVSLIISLVFLGLILCITGTVILAVQLLSDNKSNMARYDVVKILGMGNATCKRMLRKQVALYFVFSALPIFVLSTGLVYIVASIIIKEYFLVPVFISAAPPVAVIFAITILVFLLIYCIYGAISYHAMKRNILS